MNRSRNPNKSVAARLEQEAQDQKRAAQLAPEIVSYWTKYLRRAAKHVEEGRKPCDYAPWINALRRTRDMPAMPVTANDQFAERYPDLMVFAATLARPNWPEGRDDLIDFALLFLEADVMLFRSGYAKRHMIRRLQQSTLNEMQVARIALLLQRAVIVGTGLEEFRAYKRLSAHLVVKGHLPLWEDTLKQSATGALLTIRNVDGMDWLALFTTKGLSQSDQEKLYKAQIFRRPKWGVRWPDTDQLAPAGKQVDARQERVRRNAFAMLNAIARRRGESLISRDRLAQFR